MNTASEIIDAKGGPAAFARMIGKTSGSVRVWKHRNQIPREAWPEIIAALPEISLEILMMTEGPARAPAKGEAS